MWHDWILDIKFTRRTNKEHCTISIPKKKRKKILAQEALHDHKWVRHNSPINSPIELKEVEKLWEAIRDIKGNEEEEDQIRWSWTHNGEYNMNNAYQIQFIGVTCKLNMNLIWKAKTEPKCHFFVSTIPHKKNFEGYRCPSGRLALARQKHQPVLS